jgi:cystathionine gamma-synthase/methionine-gamma-lyase
MYGASTILLRDFFAPYGITIVTCDMTNLTEVAQWLAQYRPGIVYAEQLSNPIFRVIDVAAIAELSHQYGAKLVIDNTIATPVIQRPLLLGADFVAHSATKYFSGHGDATGGVVAVREQASMSALRHINATLGMVLGPFEALQILRGMKTMPLRVERQCTNSLAIATWLEQHPAVARVIYPGLPSHPDYSLATRTLPAFGAMLSFELHHPARLETFVNALELVLMASTLGDIYTLISIPALASHRGLSPQERAQRGISDGLIRMSVGIEAQDDLRADLDQALQQTLR